jgi:xanthine/CO dehydrogenase XdhC/CoxF family maturation factor
VHLGITALLEFFDDHRADDALVCATIIATSGSTYRKPGAMMLIARDGSYAGLISGGCLEGDLLHHAVRVFDTTSPAYVTYDLHADEELVWSLGLGCDGVIHLMLQRLEREPDFGFLGPLARAYRARQPLLLGLVTETDGAVPSGAWALAEKTDISTGEPVLAAELDELRSPWPEWRCQRRRFGLDGQGDAIVLQVPARTRVLLCGAGPDAVPLARLLDELDWEVWIADHRPAFARAGRFPERCRVLCCRPEALAAQLDPATLDAAVIMSHHLENDAAYLRQLAPSTIPYIGILGPRARRDRLREMVACPERAAYGPVGLDIGAELPAAIALSVAAEIHAVLNGRDGRSLSLRTDKENGQGT